MTTTTRRAALYARYSSTLQDVRSVEDQLRDCRARCEREGWAVVDTFADYAISGAVRERPALNAMLDRVARGEVDIVLSEALDRISRDQEDIAGIYKRIRFAGARIFTLSEGEIGELHIGFTGTMASMFRAGLADKIRRGQRGRVAAGRIPGGICYGYRKVIALRPDGEPERGLRAIDPDQAAVVRRIVAEFLAGRSAIAIVRGLNAEGVPGPRGGKWCVSMINGDPARQNGILQNEIYAGRLVYNRTRKVRDPDSRRRVSRINPRTEWQVVDAPELAIIAAVDWQAVRDRREREEGKPYSLQRRAKRLLSGLVVCGCCGDDYIVAGKEWWACGNHRAGKGCTNNRRISTAALESQALAALRDQLLSPEAVALFVAQYRTARADQLRANDAANARHRKAADDAAAKVRRLVTAIADGGGEFPEIRAALRQARADQAAATAALAEVDAGNVLALHPGIADAYRQQVEDLSAALTSDQAAATEATPAIRALIDRVTAMPNPDGRGCTITVSGRIAALVNLGTQAPEKASRKRTARQV